MTIDVNVTKSSYKSRLSNMQYIFAKNNASINDQSTSSDMDLNVHVLVGTTTDKQMNKTLGDPDLDLFPIKWYH